MSEMKRNPEAVAELIREARTIAVVSHVNPDGDTIGCATAMRLGLKALGKDVTLFCDGKIPDDLGFLPGAADFRHPEGYEGSFDLMLSVDVSDERRLGSCAELKKISRRTAQIDHHPTNPLFMEVNSVDVHAPAACLMIREQLRVLGVELTTDIAKCLYTGISTDTGNFAFAATNAECFEVMAELMRAGLPLAELNRILFRVRSRPQALLIGKALGKLRFRGDGKIAVMLLTMQDFRDCGALSEHADTLVNFGLDTAGTEMALLGRETGDGKVKFSLRAREPMAINDVAQLFGGGGHPQASGITMEGTLEETAERVLAAMEKKLKESEQA